MFDFGALPPEINSGRLYAGPGSAPMMAAATAWDALASELSLAAVGYGSVISELTSGPWVGPASTSMLSAIAPYMTWLHATAGQAERAAMQARVAAAAYETAFMMTVPPPVIAANRASLMTLVATNFFGQNTPAIAANEAEYAQMWAQDAAAMYGYAGSSAAAATLHPFTPPPATANPTGPAAQAVAVGLAAALPAGVAGETIASMAPSLVTTSAAAELLQQLSWTAAFPSYAALAKWLEDNLPHLSIANRTTIVRLLGESYFLFGMGAFVNAIAQALIPGTPAGAGSAGSSVLDSWGPALAAGLGVGSANPVGAAGNAAGLSSYTAELPHVQPAATAVLGQARWVGSLSTPSSWPSSVSVEPAGFGEEPFDVLRTSSSAGSVDGILGGLPVGGLGHGSGGFAHRYGFRYKVMPRPPCAG